MDLGVFNRFFFDFIFSFFLIFLNCKYLCVLHFKICFPGFFLSDKKHIKNGQHRNRITFLASGQCLYHFNNIPSTFNFRICYIVVISKPKPFHCLCIVCYIIKIQDIQRCFKLICTKFLTSLLFIICSMNPSPDL